MNRYGEEISYDFKLLKVEDYTDLQPFACGNEKLDGHIHNGIIQNSKIIDEDGLYFVFRDRSSNKIIAVVSLATSGIVFEQTNYMHVLPAIKIDVLAVDVNYQRCTMIEIRKQRHRRMIIIILAMILWEKLLGIAEQ